MTCADDFLDATNPVFDECQHGIATLSRVMVATPAALGGAARTALLPALYAYWERFFRMTFSEYLRSVSLAAIPFDRVSPPLARGRIRAELLRLETSHRDRVLRLLDNESAEAARTYVVATIASLTNIESVYKDPVLFSPPDEWINTEANVRYEVVEKNCRLLGVNPEDLKRILRDSNIELYPRLKELVDKRNLIAHGTTLGPTSGSEWDGLQNFVVALMNAVQLFLYEALLSGTHLAPNPTPP